MGTSAETKRVVPGTLCRQYVYAVRGSSPALPLNPLTIQPAGSGMVWVMPIPSPEPNPPESMRLPGGQTAVAVPLAPAGTLVWLETCSMKGGSNWTTAGVKVGVSDPFASGGLPPPEEMVGVTPPTEGMSELQEQAMVTSTRKKETNVNSTFLLGVKGLLLIKDIKPLAKVIKIV
jgi:hypothetical protein